MGMIESYMEAFAHKDLQRISELLAADVVLQDPFVGRVEGREAVLAVYAEIFEADLIEVELLRRYHGVGNGPAQEFRVRVTDQAGSVTVIEGIDLFEFAGGEISSIRAFVEVCTP
jgi:limonene-1,2-epoxide hydrolase